MITIHTHSYRCPHCHERFATIEVSDDVDFTCDACGNGYTLGEARRGRPDPDPSLVERIATLERTVAELQAMLDGVVLALNRRPSDPDIFLGR